MPLAPRRVRSALLLALLVLVALFVSVTDRTGAPLAVHARAASTDAMRSAVVAPSGLRVLQARIHFSDPATPGAAQPAIHTAAGILVDIDTGAVLWAQDPHRELPPASTTKILTALVVLENLDPDAPVTVTQDALGQAWDETRMGLQAGATLTARELLTGMLLVSGNDAAMALAVDTVGISRFVATMNAQAAALGLHDSQFTSPVGLQDPGHFTSAYDLAVIATAAVESFPLFAQLVDTRAATVPATATHPAFVLRNIDALLGMYPYAVGIKPGWTAAAGYCEVGMAVRDGHRLLSVLLDAPYVFRQSRALLDWGFTQEGLPSTLPPPSPSPSARA